MCCLFVKFTSRSQSARLEPVLGHVNPTVQQRAVCRVMIGTLDVGGILLHLVHLDLVSLVLSQEIG